jgi:hypothetical protein
MTYPLPPEVHENPDSLRNRGLSLIRTYVPTLWGAVLTWAATQLPVLEPALNSEAALGVGAFLVALLTSLWYTLMRWLEPKLPAWLTVIVLGANARPAAYTGQVVNGSVTHVANVPRQAEGR